MDYETRPQRRRRILQDVALVVSLVLALIVTAELTLGLIILNTPTP